MTQVAYFERYPLPQGPWEPPVLTSDELHALTAGRSAAGQHTEEIINEILVAQTWMAAHRASGDHASAHYQGADLFSERQARVVKLFQRLGLFPANSVPAPAN